MISVLLKIKHHAPSLWRRIEQVNSFLFRILRHQQIMANANACLKSYRLSGFSFRPLTQADTNVLSYFLKRQTAMRMEFFKPHGFDVESVARQTKDPAFIMFGAFHDETLVGYFFLRCFWNRKSFIGRVIDKDWEGRGIGRVMNQILYNTAWNSDFKCLTTISKHNHSVIRSHANNPTSRMLAELPNDYMLVELVHPEHQSEGQPLRDRLNIR